jgi:hypothetical protein
MTQYIKANMPAPAAGDLADYTVQTPKCALDETTVPPAGKEGTTTGGVRYEGRVAALASVLAFGWADAALIGCIGCRPVCHSSRFLSLSLSFSLRLPLLAAAEPSSLLCCQLAPSDLPWGQRSVSTGGRTDS